jgi:hypothetical protein
VGVAVASTDCWFRPAVESSTSGKSAIELQGEVDQFAAKTAEFTARLAAAEANVTVLRQENEELQQKAKEAREDCAELEVGNMFSFMF